MGTVSVGSLVVGDMRGASMTGVKYLLFFFNLVFAVTGLLLLVMGLVVQSAHSQYLDFLSHRLLSPPVLLTVLGGVIFGISFFGCCGAIRESHALTRTFSVLLAVVFFVEMIAVLAAYHMREQMVHSVERRMEAGMRNFFRQGYRGVSETWNVVQHELECCGTQSYTDWINTTFSARENVPDSCCLSDVVGCGLGILNLGHIQAAMKVHTRGCLEVFSHQLSQNSSTVGGLALIVALIQFIGMVLSFLLANSIKKECEIV